MDHRLQIILAAKDLTGNVFTKFKGTVGAITKSIFSLRGAIGVLGGTTGMGYLVKSSLDAADVIGKTAAKLGISTSALQEFQYAANLSGVSTETLNMALQRFTRRTAEAAQGKGELRQVLEQYNIAAVDAAGNTRKVEDVLGDLADVMARTDSGSERLRIAFKAFDSEGAALVNMLKNGSAAMDLTRQKARDLGLVISDSLIANAANAKDNLHTLGTVLRTQVTGAILELAPEITKISASILSWVKENEKLLSQDLPDHIAKIAKAMGTIAKYAGLRSIMNTFTKGGELAAKGLIDWNKFVTASFLERQKMVDDAILQMERLGRVTGKINADTPGYDAYVRRAASVPARAAGTTVDSPTGRWSPRSDRGPWAPRAGGMVGVVEAEKKLLAEMTESTETAYDKMDAHVQAYYDNIEAQAQKTAAGVGYLADTMSNAFTGFVTDGKFSFSDFADSIIADLIRIQSRTLLTNLFSSAASGAGSGFFSFFSPNAAGAAYTPAGRARFAAGGVINRPTVFPFAGGMGLMGEAGPEGILPLARTRGGDLGVKTTGGGNGNDVQVIVNNNSGTPATVSQSNDPDGLRRIIIDIAKNDVLRGGALARATEQVYHLSRKGRIV